MMEVLRLDLGTTQENLGEHFLLTALNLHDLGGHGSRGGSEEKGTTISLGEYERATINSGILNTPREEVESAEEERTEIHRDDTTASAKEQLTRIVIEDDADLPPSDDEKEVVLPLPPSRPFPRRIDSLPVYHNSFVSSEASTLVLSEISTTLSGRPSFISSDHSLHSKTTSSSSILSSPTASSMHGSAAPSIKSINTSSTSQYRKIRHTLRRFSQFAKRRPLDISLPSSPIRSKTLPEPKRSESWSSNILKRETDHAYTQTTDMLDSVYASLKNDHRMSSSESRNALMFSARPNTPVCDAEDAEADERAIITASQQAFFDSTLAIILDQAESEHSQFLNYQRNLLANFVVLKSSQRAIISRSPTWVTHFANLQNEHMEALDALENKHFAAEETLSQDLELERQALDLRIKHMSAYCSGHGSSSPDGMGPQRHVTVANRTALRQQKHLRRNMDGLHEARIGVLRRKQAKQVENLVAKREAERRDFEAQINDEADLLCKCDWERLRREAEERRIRMKRRWRFDAIAAWRRFEVDMGVGLGDMPEMDWPEGDCDGWESNEDNETKQVHTKEFRTWDKQMELTKDRASMILFPIDATDPEILLPRTAQ
ncbi:hypothetical protein MMC25_002946 [Agyrium rufum]|nr:hypothetical protein [Agyrium rufum]